MLIDYILWTLVTLTYMYLTADLFATRVTRRQDARRAKLTSSAC